MDTNPLCAYGVYKVSLIIKTKKCTLNNTYLVTRYVCVCVCVCNFGFLYAFFWVIPWRLNFICQRFGTLCLFCLHRQVGIKYD
jgi:hypothetical protein